MESQSVQFGEAARSLGARARSLGLASPVFKSPPRIVGVNRTVRHRDDGQAVVSVLFRGRPWLAVLSDLVEGIVYINELSGVEASRARDDLWQTFDESVEPAAAA